VFEAKFDLKLQAIRILKNDGKENYQAEYQNFETK